MSCMKACVTVRTSFEPGKKIIFAPTGNGKPIFRRSVLSLDICVTWSPENIAPTYLTHLTLTAATLTRLYIPP